MRRKAFKELRIGDKFRLSPAGKDVYVKTSYSFTTWNARLETQREPSVHEPPDFQVWVED